MLGVITAAKGSNFSLTTLRAFSDRSGSPLFATMTGSTTIFGILNSCIPSATALTMPGLDNIPVLAASVPISVMMLLICSRMISTGNSKIPCTPTVFWAVMAVIADIP